MAFRVVTDKDMMDALWYAGLLWSREYIDDDHGWGEWWTDRADDWQNKEGNQPSLYNSAQPFDKRAALVPPAVLAGALTLEEAFLLPINAGDDYGLWMED